MSANSFIPVSFSGYLPEYVYDSNEAPSVVPRILIGQGGKAWKFEFDPSTDNLKLYYSSDNQQTWTLKMEFETA